MDQPYDHTYTSPLKDPLTVPSTSNQDASTPSAILPPQKQTGNQTGNIIWYFHNSYKAIKQSNLISFSVKGLSTASVVRDDGSTMSLFITETHLLSNGTVYLTINDINGVSYLYSSTTQLLCPTSMVKTDEHNNGIYFPFFKFIICILIQCLFQQYFQVQMRTGCWNYHQTWPSTHPNPWTNSSTQLKIHIKFVVRINLIYEMITIEQKFIKYVVRINLIYEAIKIGQKNFF